MGQLVLQELHLLVDEKVTHGLPVPGAGDPEEDPPDPDPDLPALDDDLGGLAGPDDADDAPRGPYPCHPG